MKIGWLNALWEPPVGRLPLKYIMKMLKRDDEEGKPDLELFLVPDDWNRDRPSSDLTNIYLISFKLDEQLPDYLVEALKRWAAEKKGGMV